MPLVGDLCDFPLPEVLMLIGMRSGRLLIWHVPLFGNLEVDFHEGEVQAMYAGREVIIDVDHMVANLSAVVQMPTCQFEFTTQTVKAVHRDNPVTINNLVMSLVCYVDEQVARQKAIHDSRNAKLGSNEEIERLEQDFRKAASVSRELQRLTGRLPRLKG
jgi:hypothetical protein